VLPGVPSGTYKQLSDDVVLVLRSGEGGYNGRLFVKIGERWHPVATDGLAEIKGMFPAKK
jgi:hypothetical protein